MTPYGPLEMQALLDGAFAPWVKNLKIKVIRLTDSEASFLLPKSENLGRGGGTGPNVICGQALAAAADTASVLTLSGLNGRFRNCTTVDLSCHFMRPLPVEDVKFTVTALSNGRRMAVTRVDFRTKNSSKIAATATCNFAYLED